MCIFGSVGIITISDAFRVDGSFKNRPEQNEIKEGNDGYVRPGGWLRPQ